MQPGIGSWLTKREALAPEKEALVEGVRRLTYRDLNRRVNRLAHGLRALGLERGDRLALLAYNGLEYVEIIMAAAKLGLILVPLNWRLTAPELAFNLTDSESALLLFDPGLAALAHELETTAKVGLSLSLGPEYDDLLARASQAEPEEQADLSAPHIIMYTAGTTGRPKGAVLTQEASFYNALNLHLALDFTSADRDLLVLPMFHIGGIGLFTLPMLYVGGTVIVQKSFEPGQTLKLIQEEKATLFFGVPAIFLFLSQHEAFSGAAFAGARLVMSGGAPLPVSLIDRYRQAGIVLQQGFGMSEAAPSIATLPRELALSKAGSIGRAVFHLDVRVADDDGREVRRGEVGELIMRGPNLLKEYWRRPEATAEAFSGGWFHSGDLARMDEDGCLYIVDRKKDMYISGGENVYPAEVENAIYELSQVAEAAVIGVKDERWGESGLAVAALKAGQSLTAEALLEHLRGRLAKYKIPKRIVFVPALPRNAAGKVLKNELRARFG